MVHQRVFGMWRGEGHHRFESNILDYIPFQTNKRRVLGSGEWLFEWRRHFFQWEEQLFNMLKEELEGFVWHPGEEDRW